MTVFILYVSMVIVVRAVICEIYAEILTDIIQPAKSAGEKRVLILDHLGMKILSSCFKMCEIASHGITCKPCVSTPQIESVWCLMDPVPEFVFGAHVIWQSYYFLVEYLVYKSFHQYIDLRFLYPL